MELVVFVVRNEKIVRLLVQDRLVVAMVINVVLQVVVMLKVLYC